MATTTKTTKRALTIEQTYLPDALGSKAVFAIVEDGSVLFVTLFQGKATKRLANMIAAREAAAA